MSQEPVVAAIDAFLDGWNAHDMPAHLAGLAAEADFVDIYGVLESGRNRILAMQAAAHHRRGATRVSRLDLKIRMVRQDVAIAHLWWKMTDTESAGTPLTGLFTMVLSSEVLSSDGQRWAFQALHNSLTGTPDGDGPAEWSRP